MRVTDATERQEMDASWQMLISLGGLAIGALGTAYLVLTFQQTRRAADASLKAAREAKRSAFAALISARHGRRSADAAEKALSAATETARDQLRAYIGIDDVAITDRKPRGLMPPDHVPIGRAVKIRFKNYGQTPTRYFQVHWTVEVTGKQKTFGNFPQTFDAAFSGELPPGAGKTVVGRFEITPKQERLVSLGQIGIQLFTKVDVEDIFGTRSKTSASRTIPKISLLY
jgi:hypothetical protein